MSDSKIFITQIWPKLDAFLKEDNAAKIFKHGRDYIGSDAVMPKLEVNHPGEQIFFSEGILAGIYESTGVTKQEIELAIKNCPAIQSSWKVITKPFFWPVLLTIRWMDEKEFPEEKVKMMVMFLAVLLYGGPGLQFKYFRRFYQANAMAYAMNNLNEKFILKQQGTMFKALLEVSWRAHTRYIDDLRSTSDESLMKYFTNMWSRLNSMVKTLKNTYEVTRAQGLYLNQATEFHEDGEMRDRDTDSARVQSTANDFTQLFLSEPVPVATIDLAAKIADVPRLSLVTAVSEIRNGDPEPVRSVFHLVTELYFEERKASRQDIRTRGFLEFANAVYTRSNTVDGRVEEIKSILTKLLETHSVNYLKTNREATKGSFRKALYLVFVIFMQMKA